MIKVITFPRTLADAGEDRITAVGFRNIVNEFENDDGLADPSAAERARFAAFNKRADQIDNLDPCF